MWLIFSEELNIENVLLLFKRVFLFYSHNNIFKNSLLKNGRPVPKLIVRKGVLATPLFKAPTPLPSLHPLFKIFVSPAPFSVAPPF